MYSEMMTFEDIYLIRGTSCIAKLDVVNLVESLEPLINISAGISIKKGEGFGVSTGKHGTELTRFGRSIVSWLKTSGRITYYDMIIPPFTGDLTVGIGSRWLRFCFENLR